MGVRWSSRLTWVVAASGFVWLLILFGHHDVRLPVARLDGGESSLSRLKAQGSRLRKIFESAVKVCLSLEAYEP